MKLTVELVPSKAWGVNVRAFLCHENWQKLSRPVKVAARWRCEICGGKGKLWPVECHEEWEYDDARNVQRLVRLTALCPACHEVKHLGRANLVGRFDEARAHLARVNGWTVEQADEYIGDAFGLWERRCRVKWTLDLDALAQYGQPGEYALREYRRRLP